MLAGHFAFGKAIGRLDHFHWKNKARDVRACCPGCFTRRQQKYPAGCSWRVQHRWSYNREERDCFQQCLLYLFPRQKEVMPLCRHVLIASQGFFILLRTNGAYSKRGGRGLLHTFVSISWAPWRDHFEFQPQVCQPLLERADETLKMSSAQRPQTKKESEVVNCMIKSYLGC